jgi:hypothetical protein
MVATVVSYELPILELQSTSRFRSGRCLVVIQVTSLCTACWQIVSLLPGLIRLCPISGHELSYGGYARGVDNYGVLGRPLPDEIIREFEFLATGLVE